MKEGRNGKNKLIKKVLISFSCGNIINGFMKWVQLLNSKIKKGSKSQRELKYVKWRVSTHSGGTLLDI